MYGRQVDSDVRGWAEASEPSKPGALSVHLQGVPFAAPYWIIRLGPVEADKYSYSIVSDPTQLSLWVLVRDVDRFNRVYRASVFAELEELGFNNWWNSPWNTTQAGCEH